MSTTLPNATPILEARGISNRFGAITALNNVNLQLDPGEVLGVVGDNGAGKSTLMKILSGLYQPSEGQLLVNSEPFVFHRQEMRASAVSKWCIKILRLPEISPFTRISISAASRVENGRE
jgi:monosaccharide-transporting ATPase